MTLEAFLRQEGITDAEFGLRCKPKLNRSEIWFLKHRRRNPRADKVNAIHKATRGLVTAKDLIPVK
jgi:hypothetical protein